MSTSDAEPRIAVFLDYENLAIGARDHLGKAFDFAVVADALAERGRVISRKAYADWSYFDDDRRMLTRHHVELIDIPQRMGGSRKNAADIKMAIDAVEVAMDRDYISTFVVCTGDSDLSPLVHKLRELDRTVIGVGVRDSTSKLLPPACDEFMFYDNLVGADDDGDAGDDAEPADTGIVVRTLAGMESASGTVRGSTLKRAVLRKDPTFSESQLGFRGFRALLQALESDGLVSLGDGTDPEVTMAGGGAQDAADALMVSVLGKKGVAFTGLKTAMRKQDSSFSERRLGYRTFGDFVRSAETRGVVRVEGTDNDRTVLPA